MVFYFSIFVVVALHSIRWNLLFLNILIKENISRFIENYIKTRFFYGLTYSLGYVNEAPENYLLFKTWNSMNQENRQFWKDLGYYSGIGLTLALSIFIGLGIGIFLDSLIGTQPVCTLLFLGFGIAAGFRNIFMAMKKLKDM